MLIPSQYVIIRRVTARAMIHAYADYHRVPLMLCSKTWKRRRLAPLLLSYSSSKTLCCGTPRAKGSTLQSLCQQQVARQEALPKAKCPRPQTTGLGPI